MSKKINGFKYHEVLEGMDFFYFERIGAYVAYQEGVIFIQSTTTKGIDRERLQITEVTAPDQLFLDEVNEMWEINLTLDDFAGR